MINIAICDNESEELNRANGLINKYICEHPQHIIDTQFFSTPIELLSHIETHKGFHVLLLDVYMPGVLGTKVAQELRDMGDTCEIIFLTTSRDHAVDAFSLDATHYLVKPYSEIAFFKALDRVFENLIKKEGAYITVKSTDGIARVNLSKLIYVESDNHLQLLHMSEGEKICVRNSSAEFFELLEVDSRFYKCGNSYIINMDYIAELSSKNVTFSTGVKIPMLSRKYAELKKIYMDYVCNS